MTGEPAAAPGRARAPRPLRIRLLFTLVALALGVLLTAGADRLLGLLLPAPPAQKNGLVFPPHHKVLYETNEFSALSVTNALGFRGPEFTVERRPGVQRIVVFGDSFTYGWGVEQDEMWTAVVERNLRAEGVEVEIANLGFPGGEPGQYAVMGKEAIPLLQPDLVLVACLQGDDLYAQGNPNLQSLDRLEQARPVRRAVGVQRAAMLHPLQWLVNRVVPFLYPNATALMYARRPGRVTDMWYYAAPGMYARFTETELRRFHRMDPVVQQLYLSGRLYPNVILAAVKDPAYWTRYLDVEQPATRRAVEQLGGHLADLRATAEAHGAWVLVASLPEGAYVNRPSQAGHRRMGFQVPEALLTHAGPDATLARAAELGGAPFIDCTCEFRAHADQTLYFELDTHFNAAGQRLYGECLTRKIAEALRAPERFQRPGWVDRAERCPHAAAAA